MKKSSPPTRAITLLAVVCGLIVTTLPAAAWNNVGHRVVAELTWRQLNSQQRQAISSLLKQHPHYKQLLLADAPKGVDKNEWAFLSAAVWPDMVRHAKPGQRQKPSSITKFDLYPHAIGYPFVRPAESNVVSIENFYIAKPNAEMVLSNSIATLANKRATPSERAVSLCWVLHLTGDLHQPLHTATWVRKDKAGWDGLGGNYIVLVPGKNGQLEQTDMHTWWDRLLGSDASYEGVATIADRLARDPSLQRSKLIEYDLDKTIPSWVQEGYRIAVNFAYAEDRVKFADIDAVMSGKIPHAQIPALQTSYIAEASSIADRRIALAAMRAAEKLKTIW